MTDAIGAVDAAGQVVPEIGAETSSALGQMDSDMFLKLLVAQLRYQNPLEPSDGTQFLQQTAQFSTVEALQNISTVQQRLMGLEQVGLALNVVGKEVTALGFDGVQITGIVDSIRFDAEGPLLTVAGVEVPLENILAVETAPEAAEA